MARMVGARILPAFVLSFRMPFPPTRRDVLAAGASAFAWSAAGARTAARQSGTRIGFVDDNLENFHANTFLQLARGPLADRGCVIAGCTALNEPAGRAWAAKNNVPYMADATTLNAAVDAFMVLAPSTPDTHLELARRVLPFRKPTYVDKTFAPDLTIAREIFRLADESGTPLQSTSVLRFTNVQDEVRKTSGDPIEHMVTWGGGGSFGEYAVHPLELLVSVMGPEATELMRRGSGDRSQLLINFSGNRTGVVNVYTSSSTPYAASVTNRKSTRLIQVEQKLMFQNSLAETMAFFSRGTPTIDRRETLAIMAMLDAAARPEALRGFVALA
jgi:predicted dehydrogenase